MRSASAVPFYALLGVLSGLAAVGFNRSLLGLRGYFQRGKLLPGWVKPAVGGFATGACALAGMTLVRSEGIAGGGYTQLSQALKGSLPLLTLVALGVLKFVATLFSYASGGAGGVFAPVLFLGAMLGGAVGWLDRAVFDHSELGDFALVGMGALFAGVIRAPITSILIIFEMTGGYGLVLPLMIANSTAYVVARRFDSESLYDALLEQDGIRLLHAPEAAHQLERLSVEQAMTRRVEVIRPELTVAEALQEMERRAFSVYPVVSYAGHCLGLLNLARVRRVMAEGGQATPVGELVRLAEHVYPDDPLIHAVVRMNTLGTRHLPVIEKTSTRLRGLLTMSDIFRAQALAAEPAEPSPASESVP